MALVFEPHEIADLGSFLRDGRERRGLTLDQIASATRIPRRHLDALEHGDLTVIPNGMYRRAEVRAFADAVGLDRNLALAHLEQALDHVPAEPQPKGLSPAPPDRRWIAYAALGVLAAATLFVARWQWAPMLTATQSRTVDAPAPVAAAPSAIDTPATPSAAQPPAQQAPASSDAAPAPRTAAVAAAANAPSTATDVKSSASQALTVTSAPLGARVLVDGIGWGRTPVTIRHVAPGDRRVRVVLDGFVSDERRVRMSGTRDETTVHVELVRAN
jgi:cytoskeleton protein RodZ